MNRRLAVADLPLERFFAKPPKQGQLNVLLIVNPTEDLPGAAAEGKAVAGVLKKQAGRVQLTQLIGRQATVDKVSQALSRADVLHYCGHAFFEGPGPNESGLILAAGMRFTSADLRKITELPARRVRQRL